MKISKRNVTLFKIRTKFLKNICKGVHFYYSRRPLSCKFTKISISSFTSIFFFYFLFIPIIICNANYCFLNYIRYVQTKQKIKFRAMRLKTKTTHTSTYSYTHHKYDMQVSMYPYKKIFTLTSIALNFRRIC